jgi:hypothetical protein
MVIKRVLTTVQMKKAEVDGHNSCSNDRSSEERDLSKGHSWWFPPQFGILEYSYMTFLGGPPRFLLMVMSPEAFQHAKK